MARDPEIPDDRANSGPIQNPCRAIDVAIEKPKPAESAACTCFRRFILDELSAINEDLRESKREILVDSHVRTIPDCADFELDQVGQIQSGCPGIVFMIAGKTLKHGGTEGHREKTRKKPDEWLSLPQNHQFLTTDDQRIRLSLLLCTTHIQFLCQPRRF
jgi:hypothetical protein